ncbi:hypothetical protein HZA45_02035 [Candidatus Peregrinibacteria bacterium]|nr:hypothetical protein [Candidatus Peregrinibacteria bacterium]
MKTLILFLALVCGLISFPGFILKAQEKKQEKKDEPKSALKSEKAFAKYMLIIENLSFPDDWHKLASGYAEILTNLEKLAKNPKQMKVVEEELKIMSDNFEKARKLKLEGPYALRWNGIFWVVRLKKLDKK